MRREKPMIKHIIVLLCLVAVAACDRPIVAICVCARSLPGWKSRGDAAFFSLMLPSLERTITPDERQTWDMRLFVAIDNDDAFFKSHLADARFGGNPVTVTTVQKQRNRVPFNENAAVAYNAGAEYFVRINDDTEFVTAGWITIGVDALRQMQPSNVGVVGPRCDEGNTNILTHDMTHRVHMDIFRQHYYAAEFSAWWIDDWITKVYEPLNMKRLQTWRVVHHINFHGTRYAVKHSEQVKLGRAINVGQWRLKRWIKIHQRATGPVFVITVLTMNRKKSLLRLLASLENAEYPDATVKLVIRVDGTASKDTIAAANQFAFSHGPKQVVVSPTRRGLRAAWFEAWTPAQNEHGIILEDDVEVSPQWFRWIAGAWKVYGARTDLAGISLQRQTHKMLRPHSAGWTFPEEETPFLYKLVGSIGFSPHPQRWSEFLLWVKSIDLNTFDPTTDGILPKLETSGWFKGISPTSWWEAHFIWFCETHTLYTLYMHPLQQTALAAHWREPGEHESAGTRDFKVATSFRIAYPAEPTKYGWDGLREGHLCDNCLKTPDLHYGGTGNRILILANLLMKGAKVKLADKGWVEWYNDLFQPHERVITAYCDCKQTLSTNRDYEKAFLNFDYSTRHGELSKLILKNKHCQTARLEHGSIDTSVHLRSLEGQCQRRISTGETFCRTRGSPEDPEPCMWTGSHFSPSAVAMSDGQAPARDRTFKHRSRLPFYSQLCAMTLSDTHYGNPASSIDYIVAHWRGSKPTLPASCFRHITNPVLEQAAYNNTVTVTMSTNPTAPLIRNFVYFAPYAVVFHPPGSPVAGAAHQIETTALSTHESSFSAGQFVSDTNQKIQIILNVLNAGYHVTWADRDVVLRGQFIAQGDCDIYASQDGGPMCDGTTDSSCTGFLHFQNTKGSKVLVETWAALLHRTPNEMDQCHFQRAVSKTRHIAKVCALSTKLFASGIRWIKGVCNPCLTPQEIGAATALHANYVIGSAQKEAALKAVGAWAISEQS